MATGIPVGRIDVDARGDAFMESVSAETRRKSGSVYTPLWLVESMVSHASAAINPGIVVDCGCGSGRFSLAAAREFPDAIVYAVDNSPMACEMTRANACEAGFGDRIQVVQSDFLEFELPDSRPPTLWIGNPPYVRHHDLSPEMKERFVSLAKSLGLSASKLCGLHIHFLTKIASCWRVGDYGTLVTSAEWLDVNYGATARELLTTVLPLDSLRLFDKGREVFSGTMSSAAVFSFGGHGDKVSFSTDAGEALLDRKRLSGRSKWSSLAEDPGSSREPNDSLVPLGSFAKVHRGVVTGNNRFWVRSAQDAAAIPSDLTIPIISHAKEIMGDCVAQRRPLELNRLISLPEDLSSLSPASRAAAERLIEEGKELGVNNGYVARSRKAWWAVTPPRTPRVLMTYMSRHAPCFVKNEANLPMLNVVHGIYPTVELSDAAVDRLVSYLNEHVNVSQGRTYCGGLTKFEPREAEAILVPSPDRLEMER